MSNLLPLAKIVAAVPTAALHAIPDANTRSVLQAIVDGWQMRNGQSGSGENAFLSRADLKLPEIGDALALAVARPISGAVINSQSPLVGLIRDLRASVLTSPLYIQLSDTVDLLNGPEDLPGSVNAKIKDERVIRIAQDNVLAQAVNYIWGKVGSNSGLIAEGAELAINDMSTVVTTFEQIQTAVTDAVTGELISYTAVREEMNTTNSAIDGLKGQYTIKVDLNGYVAGFGLASSVSTAGEATSEFTIIADKFAVVTPGDNPRVPFVVGQVKGETLVGIDGSLVVDQSIVASAIDTRGLTIKNDAGTIIFGAGTALSTSYISGLGAYATLNQLTRANIDTYIGRLAVDTLYIANEAVTIPRGQTTNEQMAVSGIDDQNNIATQTTIQTAYIDVPPTVDTMTVFVIASCLWDGNTGSGSWSIHNLCQSNSAGDFYLVGGSRGSGSGGALIPGLQCHMRTLFPGRTTFELRAASNGLQPFNRSLMIFGAKK